MPAFRRYSLWRGADRPVNARAVVERGCGVLFPVRAGLPAAYGHTFLGNRARFARKASQEGRGGNGGQPCPTGWQKLIAVTQHGG